MTRLTPKVHRDLPDPDPDPLRPEETDLEPRLPYYGSESMRHRWDVAGRRPISHGVAIIGLLACIALFLAIIVLLVAAPRSSAAPSGGWATWCAPTPTRCQSWGGDAMVGAVQSFTFGDEPYLVRVWRGERSTVVWVASHCACGIRAGHRTVIDLSPAAFDDLAPLSAGRVLVELEDLRGQAVEDPPPHPADVRMRAEDGGPLATLPPTDTTP